MTMNKKCNCQLCNTYVNKDNENDIENFLEYDVQNDEWLQCINGEIHLLELLDENSILEYLKEKNKKYCDERCLCSKCRETLVEYSQGEYEDVYWSCLNHCEY